MALSALSYLTQQVGDRNGKFQYWEVIVSLTSSGAAESVTLASLPILPTPTAVLDCGSFTGINTIAVNANIATALNAVNATLAAASYRLTMKVK